MKIDPPPGAKCKDKFLVQSSLIEASMEHLNLAEIVRSLSSALAIVGPSLTLLWVLLRQWSSIEKEGKERISEQKIRCAYIDAEDEDAVPHSPDETMDRSTLIDGSVSALADSCASRQPVLTLSRVSWLAAQHPRQRSLARRDPDYVPPGRHDAPYSSSHDQAVRLRLAIASLQRGLVVVGSSSRRSNAYAFVG